MLYDERMKWMNIKDAPCANRIGEYKIDRSEYLKKLLYAAVAYGHPSVHLLTIRIAVFDKRKKNEFDKFNNICGNNICDDR